MGHEGACAHTDTRLDALDGDYPEEMPVARVACMDCGWVQTYTRAQLDQIPPRIFRRHWNELARAGIVSTAGFVADTSCPDLPYRYYLWVFAQARAPRSARHLRALLATVDGYLALHEHDLAVSIPELAGGEELQVAQWRALRADVAAQLAETDRTVAHSGQGPVD